MITERASLRCAGYDLAELYRKYDSELHDLSIRLRGMYHSMQQRRYGATFGDVEGEVMYLLIREARPTQVFEISPDCGWSTNYILAALTANQHGELHSFELEKRKHGRPTDKIITGNLLPELDRSRLQLHLGDAQDMTPTISGDIHFLLIDSCHDDWFANWYIANIFPRVRGIALVQDIAFVDMMEPSTEADAFWKWAGESGIVLDLVGALEESLEKLGLRSGCAERRGLRSNSVVFQLPNQGGGVLPALRSSPAEQIEKAAARFRDGDTVGADSLLNEIGGSLLQDTRRVNRHRVFVKLAKLYQEMNQRGEAQRMLQRAIGVAALSDAQQRVKASAELVGLLGREGRIGLAIQAFILLIFSRSDWPVWLYLTVTKGLRRTRLAA